MSSVAKLGNTEKIERTKGAFKAVNIQLLTVAAVVNTALARTAVDLSQINCKVSVFRNGEWDAKIDMSLEDIVAYMHYRRGFTRAYDGITTVAAAGGVYETNLRLITVDFGGVIDVTEGEDQIKIEVTPHATATYTAAVSAANSLITFDIEAGVGYEAYTCKVQTKVIDQDEDKKLYTLGDNILKMMLVNKDKTTLKDADAVINTLSLSTDRLQFNKTFKEMIHYHLEKFDTNVFENWAVARGLFTYPQNFILHDGMDTTLFHHNVNIDIKFTTGNVNRNKNKIIYTTFTQTPGQIAKAKVKAAKHIAENKDVIYSNS